MFAWLPTTYGVITARPSGAKKDNLKSTYTRSHSAEICSFGRSKKLRPMFLSSSDASPRTKVPRNKTRSVSHKKGTTHPDGDGAPWVQASLTTGNRRAVRNVCVSSKEPCLPKHKQQTNKKQMTQCWRLFSYEPRTKSANEYLRTQTKPNTNAPTAQNAVFHFHREDTNTHENKNKKTQNDTSRWRTLILRTLSMPRNRGVQQKTPQQGASQSHHGKSASCSKICVSSQEPCLPKHNQQTNKKHIHNVSLCPPMNQERSLQTNTYGRKQDQTQMHQLPKTRFSISIVKTRTLTKTKKTQNDQFRTLTKPQTNFTLLPPDANK